MQMPCVERPPAVPPIRRHGQIASQLHDSRYDPVSCHDAYTSGTYPTVAWLWLE